MSTENYCENHKLQHPYFEDITLSNGVHGKLAEEAGNNKSAKAFFRWNPLVANVLGLCDVGAFIERQTNQQQKAKLEKQMYNTLTVRPNIVKPLLPAVFVTWIF